MTHFAQDDLAGTQLPLSAFQFLASMSLPKGVHWWCLHLVPLLDRLLSRVFPASLSCVEQIFIPHHRQRTAPFLLHMATRQGDRLSPVFISLPPGLTSKRDRGGEGRGNGGWQQFLWEGQLKAESWERKDGRTDWAVMVCREQGAGDDWRSAREEGEVNLATGRLSVQEGGWTTGMGDFGSIVKGRWFMIITDHLRRRRQRNRRAE